MKTDVVSPFVLASASLRRRQLLEESGILFSVEVANILEKPFLGEQPKQYVCRNAQEKGQAVFQKLGQESYILSADTIVVTVRGEILEKPLHVEDADRMIALLSGNVHEVFTGYCLFHGAQNLVTRVVTTSVRFRKIFDSERKAYVQSKCFFDMSGSYSIQGKAMGFVESLTGSYTNVMGLPLSEVLLDLRHFAGIEMFSHAP
jgi:septum formation protein